MVIRKRYKHELKEELVTLGQAIDMLEIRGWFRPGTVAKVACNGGGQLATPFAVYQIPEAPTGEVRP